MKTSVADIITFFRMNSWGTESGWFWTMAQTIVIFASLWLILRQLQSQRCANLLIILNDMKSDWNSCKMIAARMEVCRHYGDKDKMISHIEERVLSFFEAVGIWEKRKVFSRRIVWEYYSYYIEHYWPILKPRIDELRKKTRDDSWYENFERLYKRMKFQSYLRRAPYGEKSDEEMRKFIESEQLIDQ